MKELEKHRPEETEMYAVAPVKKDFQILKKLKPKPGQRVFELNLKEAIIREAELDEEYVFVDQNRNLITGDATGVSTRKVKKLVVKEGCIYCVAINAENADKQFHKMLGKKYKKK